MEKVKNPLVSIIVPIYNVERYLDQCIISLIHQTYKNIEIILVDDGTKDSSGKMCDKWANQDKRIKVIHKKNGGLSDARNKGIEAAKGEYIAFVDGDDWVSINFISDLLKAAIDNKAELSICRFAEVFADGRVQVNCRTPEKTKILSRKDFFKKILEDREITNHVWRKLYRKDLIHKNLFPVGKNFEDIYTSPEIGKRAKRIVEIPNIDYFYRQNDAGIVRSTSSKNIQDHLTSIIHAQKNIVDVEPDLKDCASSWQVIKDLGIIGEIENSSLNKKEKEDLKKKVYKNLKKQSLKTEYLSLSSSKSAIIKIKKSFPKFTTNKFLKSVKHNLGVEKTKLVIAKRGYNLEKKAKKLRSKPIFWILSTPEHGNLGDQALKWGEISFVKKHFSDYNIMLIPLDGLTHTKKLKKMIQKNDIVALHAGGNIGSLYPGIQKYQMNALKELEDKNLIIFPQTFFFSQDAVGKKELENTYAILKNIKNLQIFVREKKSYDFIKENMKSLNVALVPDIALALHYSQSFVRKGVVTLLRQDSEKTLKNKELNYILSELEKNYSEIRASDMHLYYDGLSEKESKKEVQKKFDQLAHAELVLTDRLHGMLFCAITNTPCIVIKSKSYKIEGVYEWIKEVPNIILVNNVWEIPEAISKLKKLQSKNFSLNKLDKEFSRMAELIKEYKV